jgi:SpoVK/Ycf46/Vps4 family AAA+-type ATPase
LDREILLHAPNATDRVELLRSFTVQLPLAEGFDLQELSAQTPGFTAADCQAAVTEAVLQAVRDTLEALEAEATVPYVCSFLNPAALFLLLRLHTHCAYNIMRICYVHIT